MLLSTIIVIAMRLFSHSNGDFIPSLCFTIWSRWQCSVNWKLLFSLLIETACNRSRTVFVSSLAHFVVKTCLKNEFKTKQICVRKFSNLVLCKNHSIDSITQNIYFYHFSIKSKTNVFVSRIKAIDSMKDKVMVDLKEETFVTILGMIAVVIITVAMTSKIRISVDVTKLKQKMS